MRIADLTRAKYDKLLFKVRKQLRQKHDFPRGPKKWNLACVYSADPVMYPQSDGSVCEEKSIEDGSMKLDCEGGLGAATQEPQKLEVANSLPNMRIVRRQCGDQ